MTSDTQMYIDRLHIIKYYLKHRITVTDLSERFNRSRTWFYKWMNRYKRYGPDGLRNVALRPSAQPSQIPLDIEMKIFEYIDLYPSHGPVLITNELGRTDTCVAKPSAVFNVLKRRNLNTYMLKLEYVRAKHGQQTFNGLAICRKHAL